MEHKGQVSITWTENAEETVIMKEYDQQKSIYNEIEKRSETRE